jgi:hypothetical protein
VPYCPNCGGFHADEATYCPFCGHLVGSAPDAHAAALNAPSKVSAVFGATLRAFRHRRALPLLLVTFVCILLQIVVFTVGLLIAVKAAFGTIEIRRIVDTHCFVRTQGLSSSQVNYKIRSHCDVFRLHPSVGKLVVVGIICGLVVVLLSTMLYLIMLRRTDRLFGSLRRWPLLPSARTTLVATGRVIGWGIVGSVVAGLMLLAAGLVLKLGSAVGALGVLLAVAVLLYLAIWWIVPLGVRANMSWTRMLTDDQSLSGAWRSLGSPTMGQMWAYVGLSVLISLAFYIATRILGALGAFGAVLALPLQLVSTTLGLALLIATMRFLAGELGTGAAPPAVSAPAET